MFLFYDILILVVEMKFEITNNQIRFIVISDLHLGNKKERLDLIYKAYEYAVDSEVFTILNLGDLIDSVMPHNSKDLHISTIEEQIHYVIESYPFFHNIKTYVLYGNHDYYKLHTSGIDTAKIISEEREDLINLGYGEAYFQLEDNYIKLSHPIRYLENYKENIETPVNFIGHYHEYRVDFKDSIYIYAPSLSNLSANHNHMNKPELLDVTIQFYQGIISKVAIKNIDIEHDILNSEVNASLNISPKRQKKIKEYFKTP